MRLSNPRYPTMGHELDYEEIKKHMTTRQGLAHGTIVTRFSRIRIFWEWLLLNKTTACPKSIEDFFYYLKAEKQLSNTAINTYIQALLSLQKYLIEHGFVEFMQGLRPLKEEDPDIIPLSVEEIKLLKNARVKVKNKHLEKTYKSIVIFLSDTGARWEDAQALKVKSVDITGQQLSYLQLKTKKRRHVHLEEPLLSILASGIVDKSLEELAFVNSCNKQIHYPDFHRYLKGLAKAAGITKRVSPHILRHSYAQNLYDQNGDIYLLKDVLGHRSIESTMRYLRNSMKRIKTAQQMHPHLAGSVSPQAILKTVEDAVRNFRLDTDPRFTYNMQTIENSFSLSIKIK